MAYISSNSRKLGRSTQRGHLFAAAQSSTNLFLRQGGRFEEQQEVGSKGGPSRRLEVEGQLSIIFFLFFIFSIRFSATTFVGTVVEGLETSSEQAGGFRFERRPPLRREEVVVVEEEWEGLLGPAQLQVEACRADVADVLVGAHRQLGDLQVVGEKSGPLLRALFSRSWGLIEEDSENIQRKKVRCVRTIF